MATKESLFNAALTELGHRRLEDTGENIEAGRELNFIYANVVLECLSEASWNFAVETIRADSDTGVTPEFGFRNVFAKPSDWLRTTAISEDEYFSFPLLQYYDDSTFWSADNTPIYVRYTSSDTGLGLDLQRWPTQFTRYVALELATRVCLRLTQNATLTEEVGKRRDKARVNAKNTDSMNEPQPRFPPPGSWTLSRGGRSNGRDRGSRGSLIG